MVFNYFSYLNNINYNGLFLKMCTLEIPKNVHFYCDHSINPTMVYYYPINLIKLNDKINTCVKKLGIYF